MTGTRDLRPLLFACAEWYETLEAPTADVPSVWYVAKSPDDRWTTRLLNVAAEFAEEHGLLEQYRKRFAGIRPIELTAERAELKGQHVSFPIWAVAHELIAGCHLERVLGWKYRAHEPMGYKLHRGEWEFLSPSGRLVFVEVKSVAEIEQYGTTGAFNRSVPFNQLRNTVKGAYKQLPDDGRSTLVILIGRDALESSYGIMLSGVFQTLFGQYVMRFKPFEPNSDYVAGPSFRDMLIHGSKHRRLGCVAGMRITGYDDPQIDWYAIDNPYAHWEYRLPESDFANAHRFFVDDRGSGRELDGPSMQEVWRHLQQPNAIREFPRKRADE